MPDQPGRTPSPDLLERALDAAVRQHFEAMHEAGVCVPFDQIGATSRRVVRDQLRGVVTAVVEAVALTPTCPACGRSGVTWTHSGVRWQWSCTCTTVSAPASTPSREVAQ